MGQTVLNVLMCIYDFHNTQVCAVVQHISAASNGNQHRKGTAQADLYSSPCLYESLF